MSALCALGEQDQSVAELELDGGPLVGRIRVRAEHRSAGQWREVTVVVADNQRRVAAA
jgi:hypothetical protein